MSKKQNGYAEEPLRIDRVGVRQGDILIPSAKNVSTRGTVMQLVMEKSNSEENSSESSVEESTCIYAPYKESVKELSKTQLRDDLKKIDFFSDMTVSERKKWLKKNWTTEPNVYPEDIEGMSVKFISLAGKEVDQRLTDEQVSELLSDKIFLLKDVSAMFNKPGAMPKKGATQTKRRLNMVFRSGNWSIQPSVNREVQFSGVTVNEYGICKKIKTTVDMSKCCISGNVCIAVDVDKKNIDRSNMKQDIESILVKIPRYEEYVKILSWADPSVHKSLIQKIIRSRTDVCRYFRDVYIARDILVVSFLLLILHPGIFNPQFQTFESGLVSAVKRAAIVIAEDSCLEDPVGMLSFMSCATYASEFKNWRPNKKLIEYWIGLLLEAHSNVGIYDYKTREDPPEEIKLSADKPLSILTYLTNKAKVLETDKPMVAWIAYNNASLNLKYKYSSIVRIPLVHCIDQHNFTDFAWRMSKDTVYESGSYKSLFGKVWDLSSSLNGRKIKENLDVTFEADVENLLPSGKNAQIFTKSSSTFIEELRMAQYQTWILRVYNKDARILRNSKTKVKYILDDSWIAGIIGVIDVPKSKGLRCTLNPNDIYSVSTLRTHSREAKEEIAVTDEDRETGSRLMKGMLRKGLEVKTYGSISQLYPKLTVYLTGLSKDESSNDSSSEDEEEYFISVPGGKKVSWDKFRRLTASIDICDDMEPNNVNAIMYTGDCIEENYIKKIVKLTSDLSKEAKRRLRLYLYVTGPNIELFQISRKGESKKYISQIIDNEIYDYMCTICIYAPSAFECVSSGFIAKNTIVSWNVIQIITNIIIKSNIHVVQPNKFPMPDVKNKELYAHQIKAIDRMCSDDNETKHILWMTPGLGKTRIIIHYIAHLVKIGRMPKYCVYTLPKSASKTVIKQFKKVYAIPVNIMNMTKEDTNDIIKSYCVNFVYHDHLRMGTFLEDAKNLSDDMMFVIDEFHMLLSATAQKSNSALSLMTLCDYIVALTGTMIKNDKYYELIPWLRMISKFEVNEHNIWTSVGGVIANHIKTNINIIRKDIDIPIPRELTKEEKSSFKRSAEIAYELVTKEMIELIISFHKKGEGTFVVVKDTQMQNRVAKGIRKRGIKENRIHLISGNNPIHYEGNSKRKLDCVITPFRQNSGYTVTGMGIMITSVYFTNQAVRDQLNARIDRVGQTRSSIQIYTLHAGILTYIMNKHAKVESVARMLDSFSDYVNATENIA